MSPRFSQPAGIAVTTFTALAPGAMCTQVQPENIRVAAITDDKDNRRMDNSGGGNEKRTGLWARARESCKTLEHPSPPFAARKVGRNGLLRRDRLAVGIDHG